MKLSECVQGDNLVVTKVGGKGSFRKRLLEMGFTRGTPISIVKYAPLKDPIELLVMTTHISLRVCEAELIDVEVNNG